MLETNKKKNSEHKGLNIDFTKRFNKQIAFWGVLLIVVISVWSMLYGRIGDWISSLDGPEINVKLAKSNAQLSLDPQTKVISVGDTFEVNIILDTGNSHVDGVDLYALHYDPSLLRVIDDVPGRSGTQITPGDILTENAANIVETNSGNIKFSQVAKGGTSFVGKGVLATVHFRALNPGTAYLNFDFLKGSTVDSNAAYKGKDQLDKVVDGIYTIESK
jgi:hypothetical protein